MAKKKKSLMDRLTDVDVGQGVSSSSDARTFDDVSPEETGTEDTSSNKPASAQLEEINTQIQSLRDAIEKSGKAPEEGGLIANALQRLEAKKASLEAGAEPTTPEPSAATPAAASDNKPKSLKEAIDSRPKNTSNVESASPTPPAPAASPAASPSSLLERLKSAEDIRKEERGRADIGQLAETLGRSFAQIGAAQAGMKSGYDLSKAVTGTPGIDWEARRKEIQGDYDRRVADAQLLQKEEQDKADRLERQGQIDEAREARKAAAKLEQDKFNWQKLQAKEQSRLKELEMDASLAKASKESSQKVSLELSKRYRDDDVTKRTTEIRQAAQSAEDLVKSPSSANDIALVYAFTRAQDPRSTVREGEYQQSSRAGGLPAYAQNLYTQAVNGELPDSVRKQMLNTIRTELQAQEKMQARADKDYEAITRKLGGDVDAVFGAYKPSYTQESESKTDTKKALSNAPVTGPVYENAAAVLQAKKGK